VDIVDEPSELRRPSELQRALRAMGVGLILGAVLAFWGRRSRRQSEGSP
jgi:hypothetical protein